MLNVILSQTTKSHVRSGRYHTASLYRSQLFSKRPALPHQPNLYLEPKWLRCNLRSEFTIQARLHSQLRLEIDAMAVRGDVPHTPMQPRRYRLLLVAVASQKFRLTRRIFNAMKTSPCQANQHPQPNGRGPLLAPVARHIAQHTTHDTHPSNKLGDSPLLLPSGIRR